MTPQERQLVADLFERLAALENTPRDPAAARAIAEGLAGAPNAVYPLVQTVLVQDEALKRADSRIRALEGGEAPREGGFLENMRDAIAGGREAKRGSVPTVRPAVAGEPDPRWNSGAQAPAGQTVGQGSSFLGTAAAAAAGVIGGALLLGGIRSMFGEANAHTAYDSGVGGQSPLGGGAAGSDLAREAGLDDIGRGGAHGPGHGRSAGLLDAGDGGDIAGADDGGFDVSGDIGGDAGGGD